MTKKIFLFLITLAVIGGCSENSITESGNELVVVSGFLFEGENNPTIQLNKTLALGSSELTTEAVNDAGVVLVKNNVIYPLEVSSERNGKYVYQGNSLVVNSGDLFTLQVSYNGIKISGTTKVPQKPEQVTLSKSTLEVSTPTFGSWAQDTSSISLSWSNPDSSLYYVVIECVETNPELINTSGFGGRFRMVFPPMATNRFVIARRNLTYYGSHKAILYKVNQEYADLYESRTQDSRNLNEPVSNITNGLGVFSSMASDTKLFTVKAK